MNRTNIEITSCTNCDLSGDGIICGLSKESKGIAEKDKGDNFYRKGQAIFYEGNHASGLFCIYNGKVKLSKLGENGKEQIVRFANTADILGYRSLLSDEPYHATATAMEDSHVCHISKKRLIELMASDPKMSLNVVRLLSQDLRGAEQLLVDIAQKTVIERISEALLMLHKTFGFNEDGQTLAVTLTRNEIADMAATTTETTIRTLAQMRDTGLLELEGKKIKIMSIKRLMSEASMYG